MGVKIYNETYAGFL